MRLPRLAGFVVMASVGGTIAQAQGIGSASVGPMAGVLVQGAEHEAEFGGLARFGFDAGGWFVGPEVGWLQGSRTRTRAVGLVVRYSGPGQRARPFLVAGAGSYAWTARYEYLLPSGQTVVDWAGIDYFSGSIGGGLELGTRGRFNPLLEVRYHGNLQRSDVEAGARGLLTVSVGLQYRW